MMPMPKTVTIKNRRKSDQKPIVSGGKKRYQRRAKGKHPKATLLSVVKNSRAPAKATGGKRPKTVEIPERRKANAATVNISGKPHFQRWAKAKHPKARLLTVTKNTRKPAKKARAKRNAK